MNLFRSIFILVALFASFTLNAQTLIINEVTNGPSGNMEYMELVVVSNSVSYNCSAPTPPCIDIRGWIIDDNSGYHGGTVDTGVAPGAVRFSTNAFWSCIPLGTIIVIYNNGDPNSSLPSQDLSMTDGNCLLVVPVNNAQLFETNATTPGAIACSYPATGWTAGGNWNNIVLANSGDCMRIVDLAGCEVFSLCYGSANTNNLIYFSGSGTDQVWYFNSGNPNLQANWSPGCADLTTCGANLQTPGAPNNALNASYIAQFNNGCQPITVLQSVLLSSTPAQCACNGTATISASGSIAPYVYQWYTAAGSAIGQTGPSANSLCPGNYYAVTTSGINCTDTVFVTISGSSSAPTINGIFSGCPGTSSQLTAFGTPAATNAWVSSNPNVATVNASGFVSAISPGVAQITYTSNQACQITEPFTVYEFPTASISGGGTYCTGESVSTISVNLTGSSSWTLNYSFNGIPQTVNGITTSAFSLGSNPGTYVLTGVTDVNCPNSAIGNQTITIITAPTATLTGGATYCVGELVNDITVNLTGSPNWTVNYTLNGIPQSINGITNNSVSLGNTAGTYVLSGISDVNCSTILNESQQIVINTLPSALISGGGTYCTGEQIGNVNVNFTGSPNWTLNYTLNGVPQTVNAITTSPISLGNIAGIYTLTGVTDENCPNSATGSQTVTINPAPTATVSGGGTYCPGELVNNIVVNLTGTPNWTVNYTLNGTAQTLSGITGSPVSLGNLPGTYTLTGIADTECVTSVNGSQEIVILPAPEVEFTGGGTFCEGEVIVPISLSFSGESPWVINYNIDGQPFSATVSSPTLAFNSPGIYEFGDVTDAQCANSIDTVLVLQLIPLPDAPLVTADTTYCSGEEIQPMSVLSLVGMYTWYSDPGLTNQIGFGVQQLPTNQLGTTTYYVANTQSACIGEPTEITITINSCGLIIPTAFTPDGDGANDWWEIPDIGFFPNHSVAVYNRWGSLIYQSGTGNYESVPWDGTYEGSALPVASYYFMVDLDVTSNADEVLKGTVSIVLED
jgi:gliding motility-associated-like protein